jgi:hypothetical protein
VSFLCENSKIKINPILNLVIIVPSVLAETEFNDSSLLEHCAMLRVQLPGRHEYSTAVL